MVKEGANQDNIIKWFSEINRNDLDLAGHKGAVLGELNRTRKFRIPEGFVLTSRAFEYALTKEGLDYRIKQILETTNFSDENSVNQSSAKISDLIESMKFPDELKEAIFESYEVLDIERDKSRLAAGNALNILVNSHEPPFVAVRGSPLNPELRVRTSLNVKGITPLVKEIKKGMASAFSSQNLSASKNYEDYVTAFLIQRMVDARKSGLVMTRDPERKEEHFVIDSVFGMGSEPLIPEAKDRYLVTKGLDLKNAKIGRKNKALIRDSSGENKFVDLNEEVSQKETLSGYEIKILSQMASMAEEVLGEPQVLDFGIEKEEFYLFGSRALVFEESDLEKADIVETRIEHPQTEEIGVVEDNLENEDYGSKNFVKIEEIEKVRELNPVAYLKENRLGDYVSILVSEIKKRSSKFNNFRIKLSDVDNGKGIRFLLKNVDLLESELRAVKEVADEFPNKIFSVFAPHIISVDEIRKFKKVVLEVSMPKNVRIGAMVETPASVQIIEDICREKIDEVSIGLENLTRNTLVVGSSDEDSQEYYDEAHPAVIKSISSVANTCKTEGIRMSIFEAGDDFSNEVRTVDESPIPIMSEEELVLKSLEEGEPEYNPGIQDRKDEVPPLNEAIPVSSDLFHKERESEEINLEGEREEIVSDEEAIVGEPSSPEPSIIAEDKTHEDLLEEWDEEAEIDSKKKKKEDEISNLF